MYLLKDAILKAGTTDVKAVREALEKIDADYVTGHIKFDAKHNPVKSAVMIELVKNAAGKLEAVYNATVTLD